MLSDEELRPLWDAEREAYYAYRAEARGDNSRGRISPRRVNAARRAWVASYLELRTVCSADDVRAMLQRAGTRRLKGERKR